MAAMLHVIILCVTLLLQHTSYGTAIDQEFEPEQQDFKDTSSSDLAKVVNNKDSAKPKRIKDNLKNNRQVDDREKFRGIKFKPKKGLDEDLKKLLQSLVVVLQDLHNKTGDDSPDDQFEESTNEKTPSSLNSMQLNTKQNKYGGMIYKGNNEDKADIQISSEGYEKERYSGNIEQMIPPSFDPKITTGTNLFQDAYRESGEFIDDYTNYSMINNPRQQTQKRIENSENVQTPVLNSEIYRYLNRNPTVKLTDYKPAHFSATNMQRIRPNERNPTNFNKKPSTERYLNLDRNKSVIVHDKFPKIFYANVKNIQPNHQKNLREETNPGDMNLKEELEIGNNPKEDLNKDDNEDYEPFRTLNANSQNIKSNRPNLSNSHKAPTENYQIENKNGGDTSRFKTTGEFDVNTQNVPLNNPKQTISNGELITENNPKDNGNGENINNDKRSSITNSNSQNVNPNQPESSNSPEESRAKNDKHEDEINLSKPTDELNINTKNIESNKRKQINLNRESITEDYPKNAGIEENTNIGPYSIWSANSQNINRNQSKLPNPPKESENKKNNSNRELIAEGNPKDDENKNVNNGERSSITNSNSQDVNPNQPKLPNIPNKSRTKNDKKEDEINLSKPTDEQKINTKNAESNEPKHTNSNRESITDDNPNDEGNVENTNNEPSNDSNANSQIMNPVQPKLSKLSKESNNEQNNSNRESITESNSEDTGNEENISNDEPFSVSSVNSQIINPNQRKLSNPPKESRKKTDKNEDEISISKPTEELNINKKNIESNEPQQMSSNRQSITEDNSKDDENEGIIYNDKPFSTSSVKSQNINPNQPKLFNSSKELTAKNGQNTDKNEVNTSKPTESQNTQTNGPKLIISNENISEGDISNADYDYGTSDFGYEEDSSSESYDNENYDKDEQAVTSFQDFEDVVSSDSKLLQNLPNVPCKNKRINSERPPIVETNSQIVRSNALDEKFDSMQMVHNIQDSELEENNKFDESYEDDNQEENEQTVINSQQLEDGDSENSQQSQNSPSPNEKKPIKDGKSPISESERQIIESTTSKEKRDSTQTVPNLPDSEQDVTENSQQSENSPTQNEKKLVKDGKSPTSKNESQTKESTTLEEKLDSAQTVPKLPDSKTTISENSQQFQNSPTPNKNSPSIKERSPTSEKERQTNESTIPKEKRDSAQTVPDSDKDVNENSQQSQNSPTPNEKKGIIDGKSHTSENESHTNESTAPEVKLDSAQTVPNLQDSKAIVSENSQQSQNSPTTNKNSPNINEKSPTSENERQTSESTTPKEKQDSVEMVPNLPDSKQDVSENSKQSQNSPSSNEKIPIKDGKSHTSENESQTNESTTPEEKLDSPQTVPNLPDSKAIVSENSPTPYENSRIKDETLLTLENKSQTGKLTMPDKNLDSTQTVPNLPDSKGIVNENSQKSQNSSTPYKNNTIKDEKSPISENESQTKESKTPQEKQDSLQNVPNFPDSEGNLSGNSQQLKNVPSPNENNPVKDEMSSTFENEIQTEESKTPQEKQDSLQNVPNFPDSEGTLSGNSQQLKNVPSPNENNPVKDERSSTFKNESHTNESTTPKEKHDSSQKVLSFPDSEKDLSGIAQQLQNSRTQYKNSQINERSPTVENKSQTDELTTPDINLISTQTVPESPESELVNSGKSQPSQNPSKPYENTPIKDKMSPTSEKESQTNESKTPREKFDFKQTAPTFPDFEEAVIRNSQEFQNFPPQNGNKKVESSSSLKLNSQVNDQVTPGEKIGFQQTIQLVPNFPYIKDAIRGHSQQFPNLPLSYGSSPFKEERSLTSKKESQTNESIKSGEKFDTIVEFLHRYSKNPVFRELKQNGSLFSRIY